MITTNQPTFEQMLKDFDRQMKRDFKRLSNLQKEYEIAAERTRKILFTDNNPN